MKVSFTTNIKDKTGTICLNTGLIEFNPIPAVVHNHHVKVDSKANNPVEEPIQQELTTMIILETEYTLSLIKNTENYQVSDAVLARIIKNVKKHCESAQFKLLN